MTAELTLSNVSRHFGETKAVDQVSLSIEPGQFVGVIGRSGAGKSTMLRLVNRLIDPTSGSISFDGTEITALKGKQLRNWRRDCAMIFQQFNLVDRLDVITNVLIGRLAEHGFLSSMAMRFTDEERTMALHALDRLDLVPQALQRAGTLSGGQQQRVAIAKALVQQPKIMLADEPIASLDPANATRVMDGLKTINQEDGLTVLVNLHTLDTARAYCSRIIAMRLGRVMFDGKASELTDAVVRDIYGIEGLKEFNEAVTSTQAVAATDALKAAAGVTSPKTDKIPA
ncbi:MAG: phosphonate ABC transporter ATP-binding protein [Pseudomonadota bacterium]